MIPTMILLGLVVGRLWAVPVLGAGWGLLVLADSTIGSAGVAGAFALGAVNALVGVALRVGVARLVRSRVVT